MNSTQKLCDIECGEACVVSDILAKGGVRRRLFDIGIVRGSRIRCLFKSPLGDTSAFMIRGTVIALRRDVSRLITVEI